MIEQRKPLRGWVAPRRRDACQCLDYCDSAGCDESAATAWPLWYWPRRLWCAIVGHEPKHHYDDPTQPVFCSRCRSLYGKDE